MKGAKVNVESPMTPWYHPPQLLSTAKKTVISTIIGENADPRLVGAPPKRGEFYDYSFGLKKNGDDFSPDEAASRNEIWIDYVSDVGDGWNPTYSVAYSLARPALEIDGNSTRRGEILILGGDGVYPTAGAEEYEKRLVKPYRMAFNASRNGYPTDLDEPDLKKAPHIFALPGNHDWYDSLVAFQKIFCTGLFNRRTFAGAWRTRQQRSYFALRLPHNWWLLGVDLQLSHNIDVPQLEYFESIIARMNPGDKVILCVPEPYWVKAIKYKKITNVFEKKEESIEKLERLLQDKYAENPIQVKLYLAGDLHHYRRFESQDENRIQKITSGGGGAFLHPTHDFKEWEDPIRNPKHFSLEKNYPSPEVSSRQDWKNLYGFLWNNKTFGILPGFLYALIALMIHGEIRGQFDWTKPFKATANRLIEEPIALLIVILMMAGLIFFTDSNSKLQKYFGGFVHGLFHLAAIFVLGWLGYYLMLQFFGIGVSEYETYRNLHPTSVNVVWFFSILLVCFIGGYFVGSFIMGAYLFISLHLFGRHDNEAFSALKIEDYKNFLRLHIDAEGKLTICPIKIEEVARAWEYQKNDGGFYEPKGKLEPELIEKPITV